MGKSALYNGVVTHRRLNPVGHHIHYRIFYLLIDLDELVDLGRNIPFLSVNKRNLVSFFTKDFGDGAPTSLKTRVRAQLKRQGMDMEITSVRLLCIPRIFGYAFNPLSTYYCYDANDNLRALVYEVSNTFGERHSYILPAGSTNSKGLMKQACNKELYVSPFMPMDCRYEFSILPPGGSIALSIRQFHDDKPIMNASFIGQHSALTPRTLGLAILKFPFNSLKVIAGIHWEALKLWLKGMKLVPRPEKKTRNSAPTTPSIFGKYQEK